MQFDRRHILSALAAAPAVIAVRKSWAQSGTDTYLLERISGPVALRDPDTVGQVTGASRARLHALFDHIGRRWEMQDTGVGEAEFADLVDLKAGEKPSYLAEYREADAILEKILGETIIAKLIPVAEFDALMVPRKLEGSDATRLGRFQKFVSNEFITWYVARGGFKRFGYVNYRGYAGGPFTDPSRIPYRTAKI
jgi:hypothetical protein